ncbi:hypothetical protein GcM1_234110 [Golovinomyces cichoracearum]|uniref:UBC core domain-containing protein n=1 Tax=Golovinomyces cichoracearum TaxID=62708 RepID=A0A420ILN8_9PEZI|nr:hypothetical protein GcM1_234110 [Golovinomyces cichoracearum]
MSTWRHLSDMPAVRRQHLLVEFSCLKTACPHGIFMSLTPGDPTVWLGVMFIRKGPYSSAILQFKISFPPSYPWLPPLVTFSTDMFHPLITPLTTYIYTIDIQVSSTISASDTKQLPPGGFSLRHGFPGWFAPDKNAGKLSNTNKTEGTDSSHKSVPVTSIISDPYGVGKGDTSLRENWRQETGIYEVLKYIRSTFDDENVLNQIPLSAAGNPGAWYAWQTHRTKLGKIKTRSEGLNSIAASEKPYRDDKNIEEHQNNLPIVTTQVSDVGLDGAGPQPAKAKNPREWNWEGVWEFRVKKCLKTAISDSVLFGKDTADNLIRFLNLSSGEIDKIKENIKRSVEETESYRRRLHEFGMTT